jgi:murein DD-endopeptidase MepM/ murein hydrolase activator NlpD
MRQQATLRKTLRIRGEQHGERVDLIATNLAGFHVTFDIDINTRNLKNNHQESNPHVLAPNASKTLESLSKIHAYLPWRFRYQIDFMPGKLEAQHDDKAVYTLPYQEGMSHRVVQGYGGRISHQGDNRFAIDFSMHRGTRVHAARAGVVAGVKNDSQTSGSTEDFLDFANYVIIEHADGTLGEYAHLKFEGVLVEVGDRIEQGQLIGYSGNTGYSKGPHLHFAVRRVTSAEESVTVPIRFLTEQGVVRQLRTHVRYRAVLPTSEADRPESPTRDDVANRQSP